MLRCENGRINHEGLFYCSRPFLSEMLDSSLWISSSLQQYQIELVISMMTVCYLLWVMIPLAPMISLVNLLPAVMVSSYIIVRNNCPLPHG